jgi:hypothetical protein
MLISIKVAQHSALSQGHLPNGGPAHRLKRQQLGEADVSTQQFALFFYRPDWTYMNIWWNDVHFALLLAFLVAGHTATTKCKLILREFGQLRFEEVVKLRSNRCFRLYSQFVGLYSERTQGGVGSPAGLGEVEAHFHNLGSHLWMSPRHTWLGAKHKSKPHNPPPFGPQPSLCPFSLHG